MYVTMFIYYSNASTFSPIISSKNKPYSDKWNVDFKSSNNLINL